MLTDLARADIIGAGRMRDLATCTKMSGTDWLPAAPLGCTSQEVGFCVTSGTRQAGLVFFLTDLC